MISWLFAWSPFYRERVFPWRLRALGPRAYVDLLWDRWTAPRAERPMKPELTRLIVPILSRRPVGMSPIFVADPPGGSCEPTHWRDNSACSGEK